MTPEQWQRAVNLEAKTRSAKTLKNAWGFVSSVIEEATGKRSPFGFLRLWPMSFRS